MTQAHGIVTWLEYDRDGGVTTGEEFLSETDGLTATEAYGRIYPTRYFDYKAPFNVMLTTTPKAEPKKRPGDEYDMAAPLDALIATLDKNGKIDSEECAKLYELMLALHGSSVANEWYNRVSYNSDEDRYHVEKSNKRTVIAYTQHIFEVDVADGQDVKDAVHDYLCGDNFVHEELSPLNTVYIVPEN